jgi:hypothetical protein
MDGSPKNIKRQFTKSKKATERSLGCQGCVMTKKAANKNGGINGGTF